MHYRWLVLCCAVLGLASPAWAQNGPADTLNEHFAAISAEEYLAADQYFSTAFLHAFKSEERAAVDQYYLTRRAQLVYGFHILDVMELADPDYETVRVTVEFGDPFPEAPVGVTERIYYYLVRQKVEADAPLADSDGWAWRIDIFDAVSYDTLADARRRPYLYTRESWEDDTSRELRSRQGLFRIQLALSNYYQAHGQFPFRLQGGDNRRDELISGGYLVERYPPNGFNNSPMKAIEFGKKSSGDFAYYSVDADGDEVREGYWLLLHGKVRDAFCFSGYDTIYILSGNLTGSQTELAASFAEFWVERGSEHLELSPALLAREQPVPTGSWLEPLHEPLQPADGELSPPLAVEDAPPQPVVDTPVAPAESAAAAPPAVIETPPESAPVDTTAAPPAVDGESPTAATAALTADQTANQLKLLTSSFWPAATAAVPPAVELLLPVPTERLLVFDYGW